MPKNQPLCDDFVPVEKTLPQYDPVLVLFNGTASHAGDYTHHNYPETPLTLDNGQVLMKPQGELISALAKNISEQHQSSPTGIIVDAEQNLVAIQVDGPGSGNHQVKFQPNGYSYSKTRATLTGAGLDENIQFAMTTLKTYLSIAPQTLILAGWSRGGVSAIKMANIITKDPFFNPTTKLVVLGIDPVPGPCNSSDDTRSLPDRVTDYYGFYAMDEHSFGFSPILPKTDPKTQVHIDFYPGRHATLVGNPGYSQGKKLPVIRDYDLSAVGLLVKDRVEKCITHHGFNQFKHCLNLTHEQLLQVYGHAQANREGYRILGENTYYTFSMLSTYGLGRPIDFGNISQWYFSYDQIIHAPQFISIPPGCVSNEHAQLLQKSPVSSVPKTHYPNEALWLQQVESDPDWCAVILNIQLPDNAHPPVANFITQAKETIANQSAHTLLDTDSDTYYESTPNGLRSDPSASSSPLVSEHTDSDAASTDSPKNECNSDLLVSSLSLSYDSFVPQKPSENPNPHYFREAAPLSVFDDALSPINPDPDQPATALNTTQLNADPCSDAYPIHQSTSMHIFDQLLGPSSPHMHSIPKPTIKTEQVPRKPKPRSSMFLGCLLGSVSCALFLLHVFLPVIPILTVFGSGLLYFSSGWLFAYLLNEYSLVMNDHGHTPKPASTFQEASTFRDLSINNAPYVQEIMPGSLFLETL